MALTREQFERSLADAGLIDIDIADRIPPKITTTLAQWADIVVTMGCGDQCPYIPGTRYIDWELQDPAGQGPNDVRRTRDDIEHRIRELLKELDAAAYT